MFFHVRVFELFDPSSPARRGRGELFWNLSQDDLKERIIEPWDQGQRMLWGGRTADPEKAGSITVLRTPSPVDAAQTSFNAVPGAEDVTNEWVLGPPGRLATASVPTAVSGPSAAASALRDPRRVMVVHGRNLRARDAMFNFLRALGLSPMEWEEAVSETGIASPHNLDAVRAAMDVGQAVVVVLTAEDRAGLLPDLAVDDDDDDTLLRGQPRQNVILEAGLAMGVDRARVILVELGQIRRASDFEGLNAVRLTNAPAARLALRNRLERAGCDVNDSGASDWTRPEAGSDFEGAIVPWSATSGPD